VRYGLRIRPSALQELQALQDRDRARVVRRIDALAGNPRPPGSLKMAGTGSEYRLRAGDYRVIYTVDDGARMVTVEKVGHRGDVYRRR
jgi:mRNA interferase RelE/StbE